MLLRLHMVGLLALPKVGVRTSLVVIPASAAMPFRTSWRPLLLFGFKIWHGECRGNYMVQDPETWVRLPPAWLLISQAVAERWGAVKTFLQLSSPCQFFSNNTFINQKQETAIRNAANAEGTTWFLIPRSWVQIPPALLPKPDPFGAVAHSG